MDQYCILCGEYVELVHEGYIHTLQHKSKNEEGYLCQKCLSEKLNNGKRKRNCLYCNKSSDYILSNNQIMYSLGGGEPALAPERDRREIICQEHFDYLQEDRSDENLPLDGVMNPATGASELSESSESSREYHAFISHASENKEPVARPLADELVDMGLDIWYDDFELSVGDELTESIDYGLANSDYGIVIISNEFIDKDWPEREMRSLLSREVGRNKVILPVWYEVTHEEVAEFSPLLADKLAVKAIAQNIPQVAEELYEEIAR